MNILHIASISNSNLDGISVAVPLHIISESNYEKVSFYNIANIKIDTLIDYQIYNISKDILSMYDFIIFHGIYEKTFIQIYKELVILNIPYFIVPHGCLTKKAIHKKFIKKMLGLVLVFNKFIKKSNALILLSHSERNNLYYLFNKQKYIISSNGINNSNIKKNSFNSIIKFIYIGRLEYKIKGFDLLLNAIKEVIKIYDDFQLNIYGPDKNNRKKILLKNIHKRNLQNHVFVNDPVQANDKINALLNSDVFIQTSRTEGLPMGIIEALNFGLPVIVTYGTSLGDIVDDNNLGIACNTNIKSIYYSIIKMIINKDNFIDISKRAIDYTKKEFNWNDISFKLINELKNNLNKKI